MRRLQEYTGVRERLLRVYLFFWNGLNRLSILCTVIDKNQGCASKV